MHGAVVSIAIAALFGCKYQGSAELDAAPRVGVGFQFTNSLTDESVGTHRVSIGLASPSTETVTVEIRIDDSGSAEEGVDFSLLTQSVTFTPGQTQADVELSITNDGIEEPDETIELRFGDVQNAVVVHDTHRVTINSDFLPRVTFVEPSSNAAEDGPAQQTYMVVLDIPSDVEVVVGYAFTGSAAGLGVDHDGADTTLRIPVGMTSAPLVVNIVDDDYDEFDEDFLITLTAQEGAVIGAVPIHTHTILDEDPEPSVSFAAAGSSGAEAGSGVAFDAVLSQPSGKGVVVQCGVSGGDAEASDYAVSGCPITFPPYVGTRSATVVPLDDSVDEDDETVNVTMTSADTASIGGQATYQFSIVDDDASPTIEFTSGSSTTPEDGSEVSLTVTKSAASERVVQFDIAVTGGSAVAPGDFSVAAGPYSIPIGMNSVSFSVSIVSDNLDESNENFTLGFTNVVAATASGTTTHTGDITDDDVGASWTTAGMSANEGNGSGTNQYNYNVTLDASSTKTVTMTVSLAGSTANGSDGGVAPLALTFVPGDTQETVVVTVNRDNSSESDNTFVMTLVAGAYAEIKTPATVTHTILNDD
jgi:hypothetical protein